MSQPHRCVYTLNQLSSGLTGDVKAAGSGHWRCRNQNAVYFLLLFLFFKKTPSSTATLPLSFPFPPPPLERRSATGTAEISRGGSGRRNQRDRADVSGRQASYTGNTVSG